MNAIPELATLVASLIAAVIDGFTGEIPEWLTVPTIVLGIAYAAVSGYAVPSIAVAAITLAVGYALYYTGQLGGGDVLLLAGIGAWIPTVVPENFGILAYVLNTPLTILVLGLIYSSIFFSIYYSLRLCKKKRWYCLAIAPYPFLPPLLAATYGTVLTAYFGTAHREYLFVRERRVENLLPEDVLAESVECLPPGKKVLERKDIMLLQKSGVKTVKVLDNLPRFGPFIFLALVTVLWLVAHPGNMDSYASALLSLKINLFP